MARRTPACNAVTRRPTSSHRGGLKKRKLTRRLRSKKGKMFKKSTKAGRSRSVRASRKKTSGRAATPPATTSTPSPSQCQPLPENFNQREPVCCSQ